MVFRGANVRGTCEAPESRWSPLLMNTRQLQKSHKCVVSLLKRNRIFDKDGKQKPFTCSQCPKSFTQRMGLVMHERSHAPPGARPLHLHRCPVCPKVFLYASGLSRHQAVHDGRGFVCPECCRMFIDKSSLRRHRQNAH
ncbi:Oocyte zinc finger protein XlCOF28 [Eumeta japonica]|uniref:Oocyte zinc finger protein XlCOF28 n=1 Tax=Eumeta variegata TaxID=151549 RepID=A0A4C1T7P3_EUMVA|nr:Oocyte zinc finger protein XlCOF28 [Eumeta japonica]